MTEHIGSPLGPVMAQVLDFHEAFGCPRAPLPTPHLKDTVAQLRVRLLQEETEEFADAVNRRDLIAIADALADVVYVAYGCAVTYGIDLDAVIREVHRSNMTKLGADGRPILRADGKILKPERYSPPNIGPIIEGQAPLFAVEGNLSAANDDDSDLVAIVRHREANDTGKRITLNEVSTDHVGRARQARRAMRRFVLFRDHDVSGVSGTGHVANGVQFPDGTCVYRWATGTATTNVADCIEDIEAIHGHGGATRVVWIDVEGDE